MKYSIGILGTCTTSYALNKKLFIGNLLTYIKFKLFIYGLIKYVTTCNKFAISNKQLNLIFMVFDH